MFLLTDALAEDQLAESNDALAEKQFEDRAVALTAQFKRATDVHEQAQIISVATDEAFSIDECLEQLHHYERLVGRLYTADAGAIASLVYVRLVPNVRLRHILEARTTDTPTYSCQSHPSKVGGVNLQLGRHFYAHRGRSMTSDEVRKRLTDLDTAFGLRVRRERVSLFTGYDDMLAMSRALGLDPYVVGV